MVSKEEIAKKEYADKNVKLSSEVEEYARVCKKYKEMKGDVRDGRRF